METLKIIEGLAAKLGEIDGVTVRLRNTRRAYPKRRRS